MRVKKLIKVAADNLFPYIPKCAVCGAEKGVADYLCDNCAKGMQELKAGASRIGDISAYSLYKYDGAAKVLVRGYKYNGKRWLARFLGETMYRQALRGGAGMEFPPPEDISFVCSVPLHHKRKKSRGFDQSEELAKRISEISNIPYVGALRRIRNTKTQTRLNESERKNNIRGAFEALSPVSGSALLVDDVLTTGATAGECANVLKHAGAGEVCVLTYARGHERQGVSKNLIF